MVQLSPTSSTSWFGLRFGCCCFFFYQLRNLAFKKIPQKSSAPQSCMTLSGIASDLLHPAPGERGVPSEGWQQWKQRDEQVRNKKGSDDKCLWQDWTQSFKERCDSGGSCYVMCLILLHVTTKGQHEVLNTSLPACEGYKPVQQSWLCLVFSVDNHRTVWSWFGKGLDSK